MVGIGINTHLNTKNTIFVSPLDLRGQGIEVLPVFPRNLRILRTEVIQGSETITIP
jgi:hypothetical protein